MRSATGRTILHQYCGSSPDSAFCKIAELLSAPVFYGVVLIFILLVAWGILTAVREKGQDKGFIGAIMAVSGLVLFLVSGVVELPPVVQNFNILSVIALPLLVIGYYISEKYKKEE